MASAIVAPLKWHGGKNYLATRLWEIARRIPHIHRVEVFGGGLSFTLASEPDGYSEVVNDLNSELMNFWCVLQCRELFEKFIRTVEATPFSEEMWDNAMLARQEHGESMDQVSQAWAFFVACRQSLAGRMDSFAPLSRARTRRRMNEQASAWLNAVEGLPAVHERLKRVAVLNRDALEVIRTQDGEETLFYLDPPYMANTRTAKDVYEHEMTTEQHAELLRVLEKIKGKFLLSGYRNSLYNCKAETAGWSRVDFELPNNSAGGKEKRRMVESIWSNVNID